MSAVRSSGDSSSHDVGGPACKTSSGRMPGTTSSAGFTAVSRGVHASTAAIAPIQFSIVTSVPIGV